MISKLEVENFLSIKDMKIDNIQEMDTIGISGQYKNKNGYSNGSGKSSLAESILYSFTGKHRYKKDIDIVRIGERNAHLLLEYQKDNHVIIIERFIKIKKNNSGTSTTILVKLDNEIMASGTMEAQNWINNYFGITEDGFIKSFFFRQKEYDNLLKVRPAERLKFIEDFLGASIFDKAKKVSAKRRNELDSEIKGIDIQIGTLGKEIDSIDSVSLRKLIKEEKSRLKDYNIQLKTEETAKNNNIKEIAKEEEKLKTLKKSIDEKEEIKNQLEEIKPKGIKLKKNQVNIEKDIFRITNKIKKLKEELSGIDEIGDKEKLEDALDIEENRREKLLVEIATYEVKLNFAKKNKNKISVGNCPTCTQQINEELMNSLVKSNEEKIVSSNKSIESKEKAIEAIDLRIEHIKKSLDIIRISETKTKELNHKIKLQESELKGNNNILKATKDQITDLRKQFDSLNKKYKEFSIFKKDNILESLNKKEVKLIKAIEYLKQTIEGCREAINTIQTKIDHAIEVKENIKILQKKRKFRTIEIKTRIRLDTIFNKCRMEIISTGVRELENNSTDIISNIGATQKEIVWETQKESLSGNVKDSLDIYLVDEKGKRPIEGLSGGEWDLTAFSTRTALARYKLSRMKSKIDFMVLDEVFGALDESSKEELISVINMFREEFSQVFVISHSNLKDKFGYNIKVEMGTDGITRRVS